MCKEKEICPEDGFHQAFNMYTWLISWCLSLTFRKRYEYHVIVFTCMKYNGWWSKSFHRHIMHQCNYCIEQVFLTRRAKQRFYYQIYSTAQISTCETSCNRRPGSVVRLASDNYSKTSFRATWTIRISVLYSFHKNWFHSPIRIRRFQTFYKILLTTRCVNYF